MLGRSSVRGVVGGDGVVVIIVVASTTASCAIIVKIDDNNKAAAVVVSKPNNICTGSYNYHFNLSFNSQSPFSGF